MKLNRNTAKQTLGMRIFLTFFFLTVFIGVSNAASGIKITKPANGSTVNPGQAIVVRVESVGGFKVTDGDVTVPKNFYQNFSRLPMDFNVTIDKEAVGAVFVYAKALGTPGGFSLDNITLDVRQTATLQSLEINEDEIWVDTDWDGNISAKGKRSGSLVSIYGNYSDGITRDITYDPATTYTSSDPSIISINSKGDYNVYKAGQAAITVSNSGVSKIIPLTFHKPEGMKPSQTVPPTTEVTIRPSPGSAGWYNKDVTITITAKANDPDVVQEIYYEFPYLTEGSQSVSGDRAIIPFSQEGINLFRYVAYDNERNSSGQQSLTIQLDKTPPSISLSLEPYKLRSPFRVGNYSFLRPSFYRFNYSATDKVSGIKDIKAGLSIPDVTKFRVTLIKGRGTYIVFNEITKYLIITAPNPQDILSQMKAYKIVPVDNNRLMYLNKIPRLKTWIITKVGNYLVIKAPVVVFKAQAADKADNIATKEIP
ncbi:MAG: hypothetical protein PHI58_02815 [Candidatus Omnitrophica bacterium]|nr:hypothetical protein [Candidatus Omnitrophota bacterium]